MSTEISSTRQRLLTLPRVVAMMMSGMCTSVQASLDDLFAQIHGSPVRLRACSDHAFTKAHRRFSAQLFEHLDSELLDLAQPLI